MAKPLIAIVDIATASVSGALVQDRQFLYSSHSATSFDSGLDFQKFFLGLAKALKQVVADLQREAAGRPVRYYCFLSSPFYLSQTRTLSRRAETEFASASAAALELAEQAGRDFLTSQGLLFPDLLGDQNVLVENKIMEIKINGYEASFPANQPAKEIAITVFSSLGSKTVLNKLRDIFSAATHQEVVEFHSFAFALFSSLRDLLAGDKNFVIVDVGGGLTDLILVEQGVIVGSLSFPFGRRTLLNQLAATTTTVPAEIESRLKLWREGKLADAAALQLEQKLATLKNEWVDQLKTGLTALETKGLLPENFYLTDNDLLSQIFADWCRERAGELAGARQIKTHFIDESIYQPFFSGKIVSVADSFLLAAAIFCDKISKS